MKPVLKYLFFLFLGVAISLAIIPHLKEQGAVSPQVSGGKIFTVEGNTHAFQHSDESFGERSRSREPLPSQPDSMVPNYDAGAQVLNIPDEFISEEVDEIEEWIKESELAQNWFENEFSSGQSYQVAFENDNVSEVSYERTEAIEIALSYEDGKPLYGDDFQTFVECRTKICKVTATSSLEDAGERRQEMMFGLVRDLPPHTIATLDSENQSFFLFFPELDDGTKN